MSNRNNLANYRSTIDLPVYSDIILIGSTYGYIIFIKMIMLKHVNER